MKTTPCGVAVFAGALCAVACGSGDDGPSAPPSDIQPSAPIASIGANELGELCDWSNAQLGGYGRSESCGSGVTAKTFASHDECASHPFPSTCPATVGQYEDCVTAMAGSGSSLCEMLSSMPPACQALVPSCAVVF
jgi:hypothetical protein